MPTTCVSCLGGDCLDVLGNRSPFVEYNLNEGQMFLQNETFCFTLGCPPGFRCFGPYPRVICIQPRTLPPIIYGPSGRVSINCCERPLYATVPPTTNQTQLNEIIFNLQQQCARQQANCINRNTGPGGFPPPVPGGGRPPRLCASIVNLATLPVAVEGAAYAFQLIAAGGTPPYRFMLDSGGFPSALSLTPDGTILGTPEYLTAGNYPLTLRVVDVFGHSCALQDVTLVVDQAPGPDWINLTWDQYVIDVGGGAPPNVMTGSAAGRLAVGSGSYNSGIVPPFVGITPVHAFAPPYTGPAFNLRVVQTKAVSGLASIGNCFRILRNGVPQAPASLSGVCDACTGPAATGVCTVNWSLPGGVGDLYTIDDASGGNQFWQFHFIGLVGSGSFTWAIFNV